jgi:peptidoglycan-associated lipoprotein
MSHRTSLFVRNFGAAVTAVALLTFASACKKKAPAAPPAPAPAAEAPAPTPPEKPSISFSAEPTSIQKGQSATLHWDVSHATDMSIDQGVGAVQSSGQRQVYPADTTTYTLTAKGPGGTSSESVTVNVTTPPPPPPPAPTESSVDIINSQVKDAYYDYDKSDIRDDARTVLTSDADVLKKVFSMDSQIAVTAEGNCDERGSAEYNLALGDRRAKAAKDFLVQLGVPADRLKTISYGKEKPVCTDATEDCYQKNRHVHFSAGGQ